MQRACAVRGQRFLTASGGMTRLKVGHKTSDRLTWMPGEDRPMANELLRAGLTRRAMLRGVVATGVGMTISLLDTNWSL
jgi:hypothetical protein